MHRISPQKSQRPKTRPNKISNRRVSRPHKNAPHQFLVSACLAGSNCRYNGGNSLKKTVKRLVDTKCAIAVCPEIEGGLGTPREYAEIIDGDGNDVLGSRAKVITASGKDISKNFIIGARRTLKIAKRYKVKYAILKSKSPSCGVGSIYNGPFRGVLKRGDGVASALLRKNGIELYRDDRVPSWIARYII